MGPIAYVRDLAGATSRGWNAFFFTPADPTALGLIRIVVGLLLFWSMLVYGFDLRDFLGSEGWADPEGVEFLRSRRNPFAWSLWTYVPDSMLWPAWGVCLLVYAMFAAGFLSRVTAVLSWIIVVSTMRRVPVSLYGFDQVIGTFTLYLAVCGASGQAFSLDRFLTRWKNARSALSRRLRSPAEERLAFRDGRPEPTVSANLGLRLIQLHLCLIYGMAGMAKLQGGAWWSGMALWGTVASGEFRLVDLTWLAAFPWVLNFLTHASLFLEIAYPVLIWVKPSRPLIVTLVVSLHVGIGLTLGLTEFSMVMIAGNMAFVSGAWLRSLATGVDPGQSVCRVLYDGACPRCRASIAVATAADPARLIEPIDLSAVEVSQIHPSLTKEACMRAMHLVRGDGRVFAGYDAVTALARALPMFWLLGAVGALPGLTWAGRSVYNRIADARPRDAVCNDEVCGIHPPSKSARQGEKVAPLKKGS